MSLAEILREEGKKQGILEGKKEGKKEEKMMVIKNALNEGLEITLIEKITKLSRREIEKIAKELEQGKTSK